MQHILNKTDIVHEIRRLNVIERLDIVADIWDEIKDSHELEAISEADKTLLLKRLANYRANPAAAMDWTRLRQEVYEKYADQA
jgi:putative addiction module component (TIGR02574 family)